MSIKLTARDDDDGRRLDRILRKALPGLPLSAIHRLLRQGCVYVGDKNAAADRRVRTGEIITVNHGEVQDTEESRYPVTKPGVHTTLTAPILYEGAGLLILNKPAGLATHSSGTKGQRTEDRGSLEEQVRTWLAPKLPPSLSFKPGPLHRLDKPSSGIIVFSTNLEGARLFSALLRERKLKKSYLCLVEGILNRNEIWRDELVRDYECKKTFAGSGTPGHSEGYNSEGYNTDGSEAKTALTRVSPIAGNAVCTLIQAEIETGRTHQIRAQAAARGHPLVGDTKYGGKPFPVRKSAGANGPLPRYISFLLHAWRLEFPTEFPSKTPLPRIIEAPPPDYFREYLSNSTFPCIIIQ